MFQFFIASMNTIYIACGILAATTMGISYTSNGALGTPPMANTATSVISSEFLNLMLVAFNAS